MTIIFYRGCGMRRLMCWLFGHSLICLHRDLMRDQDGAAYFETTGWACQHCGMKKTEGWNV